MSDFAYEPPTFTVDQMDAAIRAELPGVQFRIAEDHTFMLRLQVHRKVEEFNYPIDSMVAYEPGALAWQTERVINLIRQKAADDYGIEKLIAARVKAAEEATAKAVHEATINALLAELEQFRPVLSRQVWLDDDDNLSSPDDENAYPTWENYRGPLPPNIAQVAAWASNHRKPRTKGTEQ